MLDSLRRRYEREQFHPSLLGLFVNPFYFARNGLNRHVADLAGAIEGRTLDIGCGQKPYQHLFKSSEYIGLELDTPQNREHKRAEAFYDGKRFPFNDGEFDSAVAFQVFEHVFNPVEFLGEVNRVLRIDGTLLLTIPFVWDEHEQPYDFARYSSFGLRHLLAEQGFEVCEHRKSVADVRVVFQLLNAYTFKKTWTGRPYVDLLTCATLMAPFNVVGQILGCLLPANQDLYLDNIVLARKKHERT